MDSIINPKSLIQNPKSFRVLILHNRYRQPGGEDVVVASQAKLLREKGHEIHLLEKHNSEIDSYGLFRKIGLFFQMADNPDSAAEVAKIVREFKPHVAHVHNTLPLLSPSVYAPLNDANVKVIQYLHNYRLLCAAGTLHREGQPCTLCVDGGLKHAVRHRCWNGSRMASLGFTRMLERHRRARTWLTRVDLFVALNTYMRDLLVQQNLVPKEKIVVQPNFSYPPSFQGGEAGEGFIYTGRLTPEKGLVTLLKAHEKLSGVTLRIIGDGPLRNTEPIESSVQAEFLGHLSDEDLRRHVGCSRALVFPSEWQEPFGLSIIEAMALGKPVIASRVAGPMEIVQEGVTGLLFEPGNSAALADCMRRLNEDPKLAVTLGRAGRERFLQEYSPEAGYRRILKNCSRLEIML